MLIDDIKCIGCGKCMSFCPVGARGFKRAEIGQKVHCVIDEDKCVECGVCLRSGICPKDAILDHEALEWPRMVRAILSNPLIEFKETGVPGRGTEEIKTNEITGRVKYGFAGVGVEMGRPGVSTSFREVQTVCMALAKLGVGFCEGNPVTHFMKNKKTGELRDEILDERSLSAIVEFDVAITRLPEVFQVIQDVQDNINTVFTFEIACKMHPDGTFPVLPVIAQAGYKTYPNSKNNLGLGRPRFYEEGEK